MSQPRHHSRWRACLTLIIPVLAAAVLAASCAPEPDEGFERGIEYRSEAFRFLEEPDKRPWQPLVRGATPVTDGVIPMATTDGDSCVGLGEVADGEVTQTPIDGLCMGQNTLEILPGDGIMNSLFVADGDLGWYFFFTGDPVVAVEAELRDGTLVGPESLWMRDQFGALHIPQDLQLRRFRWTTDAGVGYSCAPDNYTSPMQNTCLDLAYFPAVLEKSTG